MSQDNSVARKKPRSRRKRSQRPAQLTPIVLHKRCIPALKILDESKLCQLEEQADWLLEKVGMEFRADNTALELFRAAGAKVLGNCVRFEPGLARSLCDSAPERLSLVSRNPVHSVELGGDNLAFMPGYGSPFVTDLDGGRRYASLADFENFVRLCYQCPHLHHSGGVICEPMDVPVNKRHLDMTFAQLTLSDKPFMGSVTSVECAQDSLTMARMVFGDTFLDKHAVMQANININSPFVFDDTMSSVLRAYAQAGQCVCVSPAIFGGAMGPVTPAAMAAQTLAEAMVGIALTQLVQPGCPVVFGSFHSTMNLRTGSLSFGTPEANLTTLVLSQLGHRLGVPVRSGGGHVTSANCVDAQAMADSVNAMWATVMSGTHQVWHAAGWLEGGLCMSYEKFVLDSDNCGALLRMVQGLHINEETLSQESYVESGAGDNFLSTSHTLRHFATANYESCLPDAGSFETWYENGSLTAAERANRVWKAQLAAYEAPELSTGTFDDLSQYVLKRKSEMKDAWY